MLEQIDQIIKVIDGAVWGLPLIILILFTGFLLTTRLGLLQIRHLGKALKFMFKNEEDGQGEVTSFGALCSALSGWGALVLRWPAPLPKPAVLFLSMTAEPVK